MFKPRYDIDTIFIMTGFDCNYKCSYCLQHSFKNKLIVNSGDYNKNILEFIKNIALNQKTPLTLNFFGGEPLLHFDIIKDIVLNLSYIDNIEFSMITNGSLITRDIAEFLNKYNFNIAVSWDGKNTKQSRLIDVFEKNKENIFLINRLGISGVISKFNYPHEFLLDVVSLDEEYKKYRNTCADISWNLDNLYNFNHPGQHDVFNIDFNKIFNEIDLMVNNYINNPEKNHVIENIFIGNYINAIKGFIRRGEKKDYTVSPCTNGLKVLNLDLFGNLYLCHNNSDYKLGDIETSEDEYYSNYIKNNKVYPEYYKEKCYKCDIRFICDGGCMLLTKYERDNYYCFQRKALFYPIIKNLINLK